MFAVAWIVFSDGVVTMLTDSVSQGAMFQTMKGLVFVTLSAVLIYALVSEVLNRNGQEQFARVLSERRLSLVLEAVNDGVWEHDLGTGAVLGAGRWTELTGYKPEDLVEFDRYLDIIHSDDRAAAVAEYEAYLGGATPTFESEYRIRAANGAWLWLRARGRVISRTADDRPALVMGTFTDLTALKSSEERLAAMVDSLRRSEAEIERFAHAAAHDLRQPVRQMVSYAQLLARRGENLSQGEQAEYAGFLREGADRLNLILDSLLTTFEQRAPVGRFQSVDLDKSVRLVLDKLGGEIARTSAEVTLDPLPTVSGDPVQLGLMFEHLIGNALKFRDLNRAPDVHIGAVQDGAVWNITISDNGIGLAPGDAERVFQAFTRLHPPSEFPGSGMGLALCHSIARHHGGAITAAGEVGRGATFTVTLPATLPAVRVKDAYS